jgi:hypothetical protein
MFRTATIALLIAILMASGCGGGNPNLTPPSGGGMVASPPAQPLCSSQTLVQIRCQASPLIPARVR